VKAKLLTNDNTTGTTIGVDAMHGVVTLRGVVKSAEEKALAGQLSANVPGATEVKNELNINSGS
jgi:osmotically-inducible protein OsmY